MTWENVHDILLRQHHDAISGKKKVKINRCLEKDKNNKHAVLIVKQTVAVILLLLGIFKNFHNDILHTYIHVCAYMHMYACACVCV